jgi:PAS domain S-box-containing protein
MISDSRRDAEKYHNLLLAIENATGTINSLEQQGRTSIDVVLESLLPNLTEALDAAQAFVAIHHNGKSNRSQAFKLISVYPKPNSAMDFLPWSRPLEKVLSSHQARVIEPFEDAPKKLIHGLEMFNATTAILMQMRIGSESRIVGVCNRINSEMGPFLGADRRALQSIVELIAIGMRVGEQRRQELKNIQNISAAINAQLNPAELLPLIARKAAEVFAAPAASLMLWDKKRENLVIKASHGLSPEYVKRQRIPRKKVASEITRSENARAIFIPDLRRSPFGKAELIHNERLRSALTAQLQVSGETMGILNIYSQDTVRKFTEDELELAEIFANQAASAIHNANLRQRDLEGLLATSDALRATLDESELLKLIVRKVGGLFMAPASLIFWDEDNNGLVIKATHGLSRNYAGHHFATNDRLFALERDKKALKPSIITNLSKRAYGLQDLCQQEQLVNAIVAPLALPGALEVTGFLVICGKDASRTFTAEDVKIAGMIADQAAIAIRTTQLHGENKQRGEQLDALDQIALDITRELKIRELLTSIVKRATQLVGARGGIIYLWDEEEGEIHPVAASDNLDLANIEIHKDRGIIGEIIRTKAPFSVDGYHLWHNRQKSLDDLGMTAAMGVPILSENRLLGVIAVHVYEPDHAFGKADCELLQRFAYHAAVAIENAHIYKAEHEAKDYLDGLVKSTPDGIIAMDKDGWITDYNEGAERICGYSILEIVGQKTHVEKLYGDVQTPRKIQQYLLDQERLDNYETVLLAKDRQQIPIMLSATLLRDKDGNSRGSVAFFKDLRPLRATLTTYNAIAKARDLAEGLRVLAEGMVKGMGITFCQILFLESNDRFLKVRAAYAVPRSQAEAVEWQPEIGKLFDVEIAAPVAHMLQTSEPEMYRRGDIREGIVITDYIQNAIGLQAELQSVLLLPLKSNQRVIGICILGEVRSWKRSPFNVEKIGLVRSMADQAGELIHRLQTYEALRLREALLKAGKEITSLQDLPKILQSIADGVRDALNCDLVTLYTYNEGKDKVDLPTVSGALYHQGALHALGYVSRNSVVWKILQDSEPHFADDAVHDPWMILEEAERRPGVEPFVLREGISSSAGIPLIMGNEKVGILFASFRTQHPFIEQERNDIIIFATQAAMAIYNARLYDEIKKTKDYLLTSQAVAWLGLFGADLQHTIHQKTFSLDNITTGLRNWLNRLDPPPDDIQEVFTSLEALEALSNNIRAVQITNQMPLELPGEAGTWTYTVIDEELPFICDKLIQIHPSVEKHMELKCPGVKAMIAPEGLRVAMEKLVNNALKAMPNGGHLSIYTESAGKMIHIRIRDTGHGIPEESRPYFLRRVVPRKRKGEGTGTGVLIARFVALSHGGDLELVSTDSTGTELRMTLPSVTE